MLHGVHKSKRPSGSQQRKSKKAKNESLKTLPGSMLQYLKRSDDGQSGQSASKDTAPQSHIDSSDASMYSAEEEGLEMEKIDSEIQVGEVGEFKAEVNTQSTESDSSHENEMMVAVKKTNWHTDASLWDIPVPDHFRVEILKSGSASFQNKDGPFSVVARKDAKAKGEVRQLSKEWFYKTMPNGEKMLRSWMVYSPVCEKLYCFCCRLCC